MLLLDELIEALAHGLLGEHAVEVFFVLTIVRFTHCRYLVSSYVIVALVHSQIIVVYTFLLDDFTQIVIFELVVANLHVASAHCVVFAGGQELLEDGLEVEQIEHDAERDGASVQLLQLLHGRRLRHEVLHD